MANRTRDPGQLPKQKPSCASAPAWWIFDVNERPALTWSVDGILFAFACLLMFCLSVVLLGYSGGFWRDEVSTLYAVNAPSFGAMWSRLGNDSAPVVYFGALRLWIAAGFGDSDQSLRFFGALASWGIIASLCLSCWTFTRRIPLLAMALVVFNTSIFYYCSSLRAYGLAVMFIMPCCAAFWRLSLQPSRWNILACLVFALLSCHTSYTNSYLLLAIGLGGAGACAACRLWKRSVLALAICFVTALSMLIYLPMIRSFREAAQITHLDMNLSTIGKPLAKALSSDNSLLLGIWIVLTFLAVACSFVQVVRRRRSAGATPSLSLYLLIVAAVAASVGAGFFIANGMAIFPWHYTPFIAMAGMFIELAIQFGGHKLWVWLTRTMIACLVMAVSLPLLSNMAYLRRTNLDYVGYMLAEKAGPKDLILINPFWLMPTFGYYYHGGAEWNSMPLTPPETKDRLNGYVAIKQLMATPDAIAPTLEKIESTLRGGGRVWLAGAVILPENDVVPLPLPPAPHPQFGWYSFYYVQTWGMQIGCFIRSHAGRVGEIKIPLDQPVNDMEKAVIFVVDGWRDGQPATPPPQTPPVTP